MIIELTQREYAQLEARGRQKRMSINEQILELISRLRGEAEEDDDQDETDWWKKAS
jgi:hypothetical protein